MRSNGGVCLGTVPPLVTKRDQSLRVRVVLYQCEFSFRKSTRKRWNPLTNQHWHNAQMQFIHQVIPQKIPRQLAASTIQLGRDLAQPALGDFAQ